MNHTFKLISIMLFAISLNAPAMSEDIAEDEALDEQIETLKDDVIKINRDLFILEEELLFPATTQIAVFVSIDVGKFFKLNSVELKRKNRTIASHIYSDREAEALIKGGVQRLYVGNLPEGEHELVAIFTGKGPSERDFKRGAELTFEKTDEAKFVEIKITDNESKEQPDFVIEEWEL